MGSTKALNMTDYWKLLIFDFDLKNGTDYDDCIQNLDEATLYVYSDSICVSVVDGNAYLLRAENGQIVETKEVPILLVKDD